ncbi:MAG TPA: tRNA (adenosine(37)-N6)-threonylcarbamoyltransferase complex ATPase subunit type 1 TsaE [Candidatus Limnocylindrales bacterium]|nr:tRNA (adenosine(37)-N6)-threonylcarbamoyltransferase complex ATPase subunit type 1 TsaE [Candidatus Limnocylindrales bacterium]
MVTPAPSELRIETDSPETTMALAARLATAAEPGDLVCLWGELGAGKTVFAKGFGAGLGVQATINSPSFVLMSEYEGRLPLFHLDLYRLAGPADVVAGGLLDERQATGVTLIEWPERLEPIVPSPRLDVRIAGAGTDRRSISLQAIGSGPERYLRIAAP